MKAMTQVVLRVPASVQTPSVSPLAIQHLRNAWRQADSALRSIKNAQSHLTDQAILFGCLGFAVQNVERVKEEVEKAGKTISDK